MQRIEIKADLSINDLGEIVGVAWPWGSVDRVGDVVEKGAVSAPSRLPMLFAHDQAQAIGVWDSIASTDKGLEVRGRLLVDDVVRAREVRALVREGAVNGLSIGFVTKAASPRRGGGRTITALELHEISIVPVPMNDQARITSAKSAITKEGHMAEADAVAAPEFAALETKMGELAETVKGIDKITERLDGLEARMNRPAILTGKGANDTETKAFDAFLRSGRTDGFELKALTIEAPGTGGALAPPEYRTTIIQKVAEFSPLRALSTVITMGGALLQIPRLVDEVDPGSVTETAARPTGEPTFEQIDVKPFEMAVIVPVSQITLEDAAVDVGGFISAHLGTKFGQKEASWFVSGNGTTQAEGILVSTEVNTFDSANNVITADDLIDTFYSIKTVYASRGSWIMNRKSMAACRKLKDSTGAYLWQPALAAGQPPTLLGAPVFESPDMPDPAATATPIAFGDFKSGYLVADRVDLTIQRDTITGFGTGLVKFGARRRVGGRVVLGEAITKLQLAA